MDWNAFLSGLAGAAVSMGILGVLLGALLNHSFTKAREAEARAVETREKRREESRAVAEILAEWTRSSYTGHFTNEDRWKLQAVYWRNILGLDHGLIELLRPRLANVPGSASTNELIVEARKTLLGLSAPDIAADSLNTWLPVNDTTVHDASAG